MLQVATGCYRLIQVKGKVAGGWVLLYSESGRKDYIKCPEKNKANKIALPGNGNVIKHWERHKFPS